MHPIAPRKCPHCDVALVNERPWPDLPGSIAECPKCHTSVCRRLITAAQRERRFRTRFRERTLDGSLGSGARWIRGFYALSTAYKREGDNVNAKRIEDEVVVLVAAERDRNARAALLATIGVRPEARV